MNLNEIETFVEVARAGSFTRAAERLGVPKGTVSRQVARLEAQLGVRLLQRTTRVVSLTDVGRAYHERCAPAVEAIDAATRLVGDTTRRVTGTLRVATSFDFGRDRLAPWLPELHRRHPELRLELELAQRQVDLVAENIDVAIRGGGSPGGPELISRKLASSRLLFCATPDYLNRRGTPRTLDDLSRHDCLTLQRPGGTTRWRLTGPRGPVEVDLRGWLSVNELSVLRAATCAGLGIGLCEHDSVRTELKSRRLRQVLPRHGLEGGGLWAVYPSRHHLSAKVRAFVDFVAEMVATRP